MGSNRISRKIAPYAECQIYRWTEIVHLEAVGIEFVPMAFEVSGAQGSGLRTILKKLSESAAQRRNHNKEYFVMRWKTNIAMTIAKRGAQVALWRAHAVGVEQRLGLHESDTNGDDGGAMGDADAEPVIFAPHHSQHLCAPCA